MNDSLYIAIDLGAGSGRVFLGLLAPYELLLEEVHRFHYPPCESHGHLRWNLSHIFDEIKSGLREAGESARLLNRPIESIGVDSWGVDYGLIDIEGNRYHQVFRWRSRAERRFLRAARRRGARTDWREWRWQIHPHQNHHRRCTARQRRDKA